MNELLVLLSGGVLGAFIGFYLGYKERVCELMDSMKWKTPTRINGEFVYVVAEDDYSDLMIAKARDEILKNRAMKEGGNEN